MQLPDKYLSPYNAQDYEDSLYKMWEESGYFNPDNLPGERDETYCIIMPPPNANGRLHAGHGTDMTLKDIMTRYHRMAGKKALFLPGSDHAGFETQGVFEKKLQKEGRSRFGMERGELYNEIYDFVMENKGFMESDLKKLGVSCDWSRNTFTLEPNVVSRVQGTFVKMYEDGLVYRGKRSIHWNPKFQTSLSDIETKFEQRKDPFYYFQYGPFVIGTSRPETKFADKYIVVHPDDERYAEYDHMQEFEVEWINGPIKATLLKDEVADMEMGSGAMTITPWHSQVDFELAEKYDLPVEQIIDWDGKLLPVAGEFAGTKIHIARPEIVKKLEEKGLVVKIDEDYEHAVRLCERTGVVVEPQIKDQWYVKMDELAAKTLTSLDKGEYSFVTKQYEKTFRHWMENPQDWNISRQIVWGIQIPAWFDAKGGIHLPTKKDVLFIRHGESEDNADKVYGGQSMRPLTKKGEDQAKLAAQQLQGKNITAIVASDLTRAQQTAEHIKDTLGLDLEIITLPELREVDAGELQGTPYDGRSVLEIGISSKDGEKEQQLIDRAHTALDKIKKIETDGEIVIVGHNSFLAVMFSILDKKESDIVAYRKDGHEMKNTEIRPRTLLIDPVGDDLTQDSDTFDTWFSSGQWPLMTLGYPHGKDMEYYPTNVMETGADLVFKWVPRMVMFGLYLADEVPFKDIYFHGMVLDSKGVKMSKSKGNVMSPIDLAENFGTDAMRMAFVVANPPGSDMPLSEDKVRAYKKFANKLWNIARFVYGNLEGFDPAAEITILDEDQKLIDSFNTMRDDIASDIEQYRPHLAAEKVYHYAWTTFASEVLESAKSALNDETTPEDKLSKQAMLYTILEGILKIAHPFMPFITEEIWKDFPKENKQLLMVENWK